MYEQTKRKQILLKITIFCVFLYQIKDNKKILNIFEQNLLKAELNKQNKLIYDV